MKCRYCNKDMGIIVSAKHLYYCKRKTNREYHANGLEVFDLEQCPYCEVWVLPRELPDGSNKCDACGEIAYA